MGLQLDLKNWVKLEILLNRATNVLRQLFFHRWEFVHHGREWVNSETTGQEFITGLGNSVYERVNEIEQQHLRSGDVTQWDLTTVAHVLTMTHFSKNEKRNTNFGKQVKEENDKIRRLIVVRNLIVHHPTKIILDDAFNHLWDEVAKLLMGLGDSTTELNKLKQRSFARMLADTNEIKDKCRNNYVEITTCKYLWSWFSCMKVTGEFIEFYFDGYTQLKVIQGPTQP